MRVNLRTAAALSGPVFISLGHYSLKPARFPNLVRSFFKPAHFKWIKGLAALRSFSNLRIFLLRRGGRRGAGR